MNNWKNSILLPAMLVLAWLVPAASSQPRPTPTPSANSSQTSATNAAITGRPANETIRGLVSACSAAVADLAATRDLASALEAENTALKARVEQEKQASVLLRELADTRKAETRSLRDALAAKNDALAAKDAVIAADSSLIDALRRSRHSPWRRVGDILLGAAIGVIVR